MASRSRPFQFSGIVGWGALKFTAGKRFLTIAASSAVALFLLGVVVWMMSGVGDGISDSVQIIPPDQSVQEQGPQPRPSGHSEPAQVDPKSPPKFAVYITGEVLKPGVYQVEARGRVADLVALAGGPSEAADLERVNLAAYVADAGHYRIPAIAEPGSVVATPQTPPDVIVAPVSVDACAPPIDINTASAACLDTLPTIGPSRAEAIVAHRQQTGPFAAPDGIVAVAGIGDGTYRRIANLITAGQP